MTDRLAVALEELAAAIRAEVRAELETAAAGPDRLHSIDEAAELLGIGRTAVYTELNAGRLRSTHVGRRRLISAAAIAEYIAAVSRR